MKIRSFISFDGVKLSSRLWDGIQEPKGVVLIVHGMAEHSKRYEHFASYLNQNGYVVFAPDLRAHGFTAENGKLGVAMPDVFDKTVEDVVQLSKYLHAKYKLPLLLFGHSYGSFISQAVIERYSDFSGVILSGSAALKGLKVKAGKILAATQNKLLGFETPAKLIGKMSFGAYDKQFKDENKEFAWLTREDEERKKYLADDKCGYVMSVGFQTSFFSGVDKLYTKKALQGIEKELNIAIMSGDNDPVGENGRAVEELFRIYEDIGLNNVKLKLYKGARHELLNETNKAEVYADVLEFFDKAIKE